MSVTLHDRHIEPLGLPVFLRMIGCAEVVSRTGYLHGDLKNLAANCCLL